MTTAPKTEAPNEIPKRKPATVTRTSANTLGTMRQPWARKIDRLLFTRESSTRRSCLALYTVVIFVPVVKLAPP